MKNSDLLNDTIKKDSDISEPESEESSKSQLKSDNSKSDSETESDKSSSYESLYNKVVTKRKMVTQQRTAVKLPTFSDTETEM